MTVTGQQLREVMGEFATGVTVVTALDPQGNPFGFTANAVASVSLDPPLVLVCIGRERHAHQVISEASAFAVNILAENQEQIARRFASPVPMSERFAGVRVVPGRCGAPVIADAVGVLECERGDVYAGGDHSIFLGRVSAAARTPQPPLLYFRSRFHGFTQQVTQLPS